MAAPATHLLFTNAFSGIISDDFLAGVSFPDIRHFGSITREETHVTDWHIINDTTSFASGMVFHQFIDETRGNYWSEQGIYEKLPKTPLSAQALKFCEDIVLYESIDTWQSFAKALRNEKNIPKGFKDSLSPQEVIKWYETVAGYISNKPSLEKIDSLLKSIGFKDQQVSDGIEIMKQILSDESKILAIKKYHADMMDMISKTFTTL